MDQELRFVTTQDGVRICCSTLGKGPLLVKAPNWLSHVGIDLDSPVWGHWWSQLSDGHRFVRFDQRGCGLSDWRLPEMSFESWVRDLECVVDSLGADKFDLLGMSQGGAVAIEYAVRHPERIGRLILFGAFARGWAKRGEEAVNEAVLSLIRRGWEDENPAFRQIFTTQFMPDATAEQMSWFNELQRLSTSTENAVQFQMEVGLIDVSASLSKITAPTLVFHCRDDARIPFEQGRLIAAGIPSARFVELKSRSHILLNTDPAWPVFCAELRRFLDEDEPVPQSHHSVSAGESEPTLTLREVEVLRLIAAGKTDREIADALFISVRTVGNHVKNILDKTDCVNRTAAAIYAANHGLLS